VLIVGIRSDLETEFSFPQSTHEEDGLLYDMWVTGEYWERHKVALSCFQESPSMEIVSKRLQALLLKTFLVGS
jgi:DNA (cytosine-5)-methyltransferase 1